MKRIFLFVVILLTGILLCLPRPSFAHGLHFHSLEDMAAHIEGHLLELEILVASKRDHQEEIFEKSLEIHRHALDYHRYVRHLQNSSPRHAGFNALVMGAEQLIKKSEQNDVFQMIFVMNDMLEIIPLNPA
ncbi:hypothetical protein IID04_02165 [PVC group bacterium]|nr:hypothetical protein [PVC group bacterium]